jgi:hypothetical protein
MKTKSQFIYVQPKNKVSKDIFDYEMNGLHSCKVLGKQDEKIFLQSIANDYIFWIKEENDKYWEVIR